MDVRARALAAGMLGLLMVATAAAPMAQAADGTTCRVRNVTRGTQDDTFRAAIRAARDGDHLRVRGTCDADDAWIGTDLVISGVGIRPQLTGHGSAHVVRIGSGASVSLRSLTLVGGAVGLWSRGTLRLHAVTIRDNIGGLWNEGTVVADRLRVTGSDGGSGISNFGLMLVESSVVRDNSGGAGGGIHNELYTARLTLVRSRVVDNTAEFQGGGIFNMYGGTVVMVDTVVTGNRSSMKGGGIHNYRADYPGGPIVLDATSSVTGNAPDDCFGTTSC